MKPWIYSREDIVRGIEHLEQMERSYDQTVFHRMFPTKNIIEPDGNIIHSREKYARHLEFFKAGAQYRERCFMAANRCITPWTYLQTADEEILSAEIWTSKGQRVASWDGESQCGVQPEHGMFLGIEQAFRVVLDSGRFFDCNRRHRVLTREGWTSLDQLVSLSSGLRCWYKRADYQANCAKDGYLGGQPLQEIGGIALVSPLQRDGVQTRGPLFFALPDEAVPILQRIRAYPHPARLTNKDDLLRYAALFGLFSGPSCTQPFVRLSGSTLAFLRPLLELVFQPLIGGAEGSGQLTDDATRELGLTQFRDGSYKPIELDERHLFPWQLCDGQSLGGSIREWFRDEAHMPIFYPMEHPSLVGGEKIKAIVPIGLQPIIDAHMPITNNYFAGGVIHHNTGKTYGGGGYEMSCHLTGDYPDWWEGRRFKTAIRAWAVGESSETTRDVVQDTLLGEVEGSGSGKCFSGTGVIPAATHGKITWKSGVTNFADTIKIRHKSGRWSLLGFKTYQQGRKSFEGTAQHVIWGDEEMPIDIYGECIIRTATTRGILMLTFTPLGGLTETVMQFMPQEMTLSVQ